jgi:predicted transcriptional regulator
MSSPRPSELELQVLSVLWQRGPLSVRDLLEAMPDGKQRAYTTILSVLQVMEKKKLVSHERQGQSHVYHPLVERQQVLQPMFRDLLRNVFGGSPAQAVQYLLDSSRPDADELSQIQQLIDDAARRGDSEGESR